MTTFGFSKQLNKYYQVDYVSGLGAPCLTSGYSNLPAINSPTYGYVWVLSVKAASDFIACVREFEEKIQLELKNKGLAIDYRLIITHYLEVIESISSGLDARSKMSKQELAEMFVSSYNSKRNEAIKFCQDTLEFFEENGKKDSYAKHWKRYDKHNKNINKFMLDMRLLTDKDFSLNLDAIRAGAKELLEELIKINGSK